MFRLVKLEDRIVLDGAAVLDALEEAKDHEQHAQDVQDQADTADDTLDDSGDHITNDGTEQIFDAAEPLYLDALEDSAQEELNVLVISSDINDGNDLAAAAKDNVLVIRYDADNTDLEGLSDLIDDALDGQKADSIAFATHNAGTGEVQLTSMDAVSADGLEEDTDQQAFWQDIGSMVKEDGRIDLLACNVAESEEGENLLSGIEKVSGVNVAASTDLTGSEAYGGDWVLESDNVDVKETYFNADRLENFDAILAAPVGDDSKAPDKNGSVNNFLAFFVPYDTFTDADGDTLSYSWSGNPSWLTGYDYGGDATRNDVAFWGTPPEANKTYTITLTAQDPGGDSDSVVFDIIIPPEDAHAPVYPNPALITIDESPGTTLGEAIATLTASDLDNDPLKYSIFSGDTDTFAIDPDTGVLTVINPSNLDYETNSSFSLILKVQEVSAYNLSDTATVNIALNDISGDDPSTVWLDLKGDTEFSEEGADNTLEVFAYVDPAHTFGDVQVNLSFDGAASAGDDFSYSSTTITIPSGSTVGSLTLTANPDVDTEGDEGLQIDIASVTALLATESTDPARPSTVNATLKDVVSTKPIVQLGASEFTLSEDGDQIQIQANLSEPASENVTIYLNFTGTAEENDDYKASGQSIEILKGNGSGSITLTGLTDSIKDDNETILVSIDETSTGVVLGTVKSQTITVKDATPPEVDIKLSSPADGVIYEDSAAGDQNVVITAELQETSGKDSTIYLSLTGTAEEADYTVQTTAGTTAPRSGDYYFITIPSGQSSGDLLLNAVPDSKFEGFTKETVQVSIFSAEGGAQDMNNDSQTIQIVDADTADAPLVSLNIAGTTENTGSFAENTSLTLDVTLDKFSFADVTTTLDISEIAGENFASAGADYTAVYNAPGQSFDGQSVVFNAAGDALVTVGAGFNKTSIVLTGKADTLYEGTEQAKFELTNIENAIANTDTPDGNTSVTLSLTDQTAKPTLALGFSDSELHESSAGDTVPVTLTVTPAAGTSIANDLTIALKDGGTSTYNNDYIAKYDGADLVLNASGELEIPINAGQTQADITLEVKDDPFAEGDEKILLSFGTSGDTADLSTSGSPVDVTIVDDDNLSGVTLTMDSGSTSTIISEGGASETAVVTFELTTPLAGTTGVSINLTDSTAALGDDYTIELDAASATSASIVLQGTNTPSDPTDDGMLLVLNEGVTSAQINVTGLEDGLFESGGETITLTPMSSGSYNIPSPLDIDISETAGAPIVSLRASNSTFGEAGSSTNIIAELSQAAQEDITIALSYEGGAAPSASPEDYDAGSSQIIVIPKGQTKGQTSISAVPDKWLEQDESIKASIIGVTGAGADWDTANDSTTVTIIDDDESGLPQVKLELAGTDTTMNESDGSITLNVLMDRTVGNSVDVTVDFSSDSAMPQTDFTIDGKTIVSNQITVNFAPGESSEQIVINTVNDVAGEGNETFTVGIASIAGTPTTPEEVVSDQVLTIVDDDSLSIEHFYFGTDTSKEDYSIKEGYAVDVTIQLNGPTEKAIDIPLLFGTEPGPDGAESTDYQLDGLPSIRIEAGQSEGSRQILARNSGDGNELYEVDETLRITLDTASGTWTSFVSGGLDKEADLTIKDGQDVPEVGLEVSQGGSSTPWNSDSIEFNEGETTSSFRITLETDPDISGLADDDITMTLGIDIPAGVTYGSSGNFYLAYTSGTDTAIPVTDGKFTVEFTNGNQLTNSATDIVLISKNDGKVTGDLEFAISLDTDFEGSNDDIDGPAQNTNDSGDSGTEYVYFTIKDSDYAAPSVGVEVFGPGKDTTLNENPGIPSDASGSEYLEFKVNVSENALADGVDIVLNFDGTAGSSDDYKIYKSDKTGLLALTDIGNAASEVQVMDGAIGIHLEQGDKSNVEGGWRYFIQGQNDDMYEGDELFSIMVNTQASTNIATQGNVGETITVRDDDGVPTISLSDFSVTTMGEGVGNPAVGETSTVIVQSSAIIGVTGGTTVTLGASIGNAIATIATDNGTDPEAGADFTVAISNGLNAPEWTYASYDSVDSVYAVSSGDSLFYYKAYGEDADGDGKFETSQTGTSLLGNADEVGETVADGEITWQNVGKIYPDVITDTTVTDRATFDVFIPEGEQNLSLTIQAATDAVAEDNETVELFLYSVSDTAAAGYSASYDFANTQPYVKTGTVVDDDDAPAIDLYFSQGNLTVSEGVASGTIPNSPTIGVAFLGTDVVGADSDVELSFESTDGAVFGGVAFTTGVTYESGDIVVFDDDSSAGAYYYKIIDPGTVTIGNPAANTIPVGEGSSFTLGDTKGAGDNIAGFEYMGQYDYFIESTEAEPVAGSDNYKVVIPANETWSDILTVQFATDNVYEGSETFTAKVESIKGAAPTEAVEKLITIEDTSGAPKVGFEKTDTSDGFDETGANQNFALTITSTHPSDEDTLVYLNFGTEAQNGLASAGTDFSVFSTPGKTDGDLYIATIPAGKTEASVTLLGKEDMKGEGYEAVGATIEAAYIDINGDSTIDTAADSGETLTVATDRGIFDGSIGDMTPAPEIQLLLTDTDFSEDGTAGDGTTQLKIQVTNNIEIGSDLDVTLVFPTEGNNVLFYSDGADAGKFTAGDYTVEPAMPGTENGELVVTLTEGASEAIITLKGHTDLFIEGDETFGVSLATGDGYLVDTANDDVTATIIEATPLPQVTLGLTTPYGGNDTNSASDPDDSIFLEGTTPFNMADENTTAKLTVELPANTTVGTTLTIPLEFGTEGGLDLGTDYIITDTSVQKDYANNIVYVTIGAGETAADLWLESAEYTAGDGFEGDRTFSVSIMDNATGADVANSPDTSVTAKIVDVDDAPEVSLKIQSPGTNPMDGQMVEDEASGVTYVTVEMNETAAKDVVVELDFSSDNAVYGTDYQANLTSVTIPAGQKVAPVQVTITPKNDAVYEGNENFTVSVKDIHDPDGNAIARAALPLGEWGSDTDYGVGDEIQASHDDGTYYIYEVVADSGNSSDDAPEWDDNLTAQISSGHIGYTVADDGLTWKNMGLANVDDAPVWDANAAVEVGDVVDAGNGYYYIATVTTGEARTGTTPPSWITGEGSTVVDGDVTWLVQGQGMDVGKVEGEIIDNDGGPVVSITPAALTISEDGAGTASVGEITISLDKASPVDETIYLKQEDLSIEFPADYGTSSNDYRVFFEESGGDNNLVSLAGDTFIDGERYLKVVIPASQTTEKLYIIAETDDNTPGQGDGFYEEPEQVRFEIAAFENGGVSANTAFDDTLVTINDNDATMAANVSLNFISSTDTYVDAKEELEGDIDTTMNLYVTLDRANTNPNLQVVIDIDSGDALYGTDFKVDLDTDGDGQFKVTIPTGKSETVVPVTILNDNLLELDETIGFSIADVNGGKIVAEHDTLQATIGDNPDSDIFIYLETSAAVNTNLPGWSAGASYGDAESINVNGWEYKIYDVDTGEVTVTTGAVEPDWSMNIGDHMEDGSNTGTGLYWQNVGDFSTQGEGYVTNETYADDMVAVVTAANGESYLFVAETTGGTAVSSTIDANAFPTEVGATVSGAAGLTWTNKGDFDGSWQTGTSYEQGDIVLVTDGAGNTDAFIALDDGLSSKGTPSWTFTTEDIIRDDQDNKTPMLWEAVGPAVATVDETDEDISVNFVIEKTSQSEELVTVSWEVASTDPNPADNDAYGMTKTSGIVVLGKGEDVSAKIPAFITGDQLEETSGVDLPIRITGVTMGSDALDNDNAGVYATESAVLSITDTVEPDVTPTISSDFGTPDFAIGTDNGVDVSNTLEEGGTVSVTYNDLWFTDADHTQASDLSVSISTGPTAGTLFIDINSDGALDAGDTTLSVGDKFTLQQVTDGQVKYSHDGSEAKTDSFTFTVDDGANFSWVNETAAEAHLFTFTAGSVNDAPQMSNKIFYVGENNTGQLYTDKFLTQTAGPVVVDPDTAASDLSFEFSDNGTNWVAMTNTADFTKGFDFYVATAGSDTNELLVRDALDYEEQSSHTLHIRVTDDAGSVVTGSFVVIVNDINEVGDDFDTGVSIPAQTVNEGDTFIFQMPKDTFKDGQVVTYKYEATPPSNPTTGELDWLWFNTETLTFVYDPNTVHAGVDTSNAAGAYTISVTARYYDMNLVQKGEITETFSINFATLASLELDMVMDALDYLETEDADELPADGEAVEVQEMMLAMGSAEYGAYQDTEAEAADDLAEFADVLALLDGDPLADSIV